MKTYEVCFLMDGKEHKTVCKGTETVKKFVKSIKNTVECYRVYKNDNGNITRMECYE